MNRPGSSIVAARRGYAIVLAIVLLVTAMPAVQALGETYAQDAFARTRVDGWGSADVGGAYGLVAPAADYDVAGGVGTINMPQPGSLRGATLAGVSARDVDLRVRLRTSKAATGSGQYLYLVARRVSSTSEYRAQLRFAADGTVNLAADRRTGTSPVAIGTASRVTGLTHTAGAWYWLRARFEGTGPTTIRIKAWLDGQPEPAGWTFQTTDATAALQTAGAIGLQAYIASGTTNAPVVIGVDDLLAAAP